MKFGLVFFKTGIVLVYKDLRILKGSTLSAFFIILLSLCTLFKRASDFLCLAYQT